MYARFLPGLITVEDTLAVLVCDEETLAQRSGQGNGRCVYYKATIGSRKFSTSMGRESR